MIKNIQRGLMRIVPGVILFIWPVLLFAQTIHLNSIEHLNQKSVWNFSFKSAAPVKAHYFMLANPNRLVIDINGAAAFHNEIQKKSLNTTPVKNIRSALQPNHNLRIVLDLKQKIRVKSLKVRGTSSSGYYVNLSLGSSTIKAPKAIKQPVLHTARPIIIVIDPGHGGKDPGAIGLKKTREKTVVLSISKKLQTLINQQPGFKAVLTRSTDKYLTLRQRLAIARKDKADMFIAIHADAYRNHSAHGASVFALSRRGATSEAARWLAARENQSELMGGVDLSDKENMLRSVLIDLSQTATIKASLLLGQSLLSQMKHMTPLHHAHTEQAAFVVLKSPDIPSLLVETGFLSNVQEEKKLRNSAYQAKLARALMLGIQYYFKQRPPPGTWLANKKEHSKNG